MWRRLNIQASQKYGGTSCWFVETDCGEEELPLNRKQVTRETKEDVYVQKKKESQKQNIWKFSSAVFKKLSFTLKWFGTFKIKDFLNVFIGSLI